MPPLTHPRPKRAKQTRVWQSSKQTAKRPLQRNLTLGLLCNLAENQVIGCRIEIVPYSVALRVIPQNCGKNQPSPSAVCSSSTGAWKMRRQRERLHFNDNDDDTTVRNPSRMFSPNVPGTLLRSWGGGAEEHGARYGQRLGLALEDRRRHEETGVSSFFVCVAFTWTGSSTTIGCMEEVSALYSFANCCSSA